VRTRLVAAAAAGALALGGCSDGEEQEPQTLPPVSPAASPTPTAATPLPVPSPTTTGDKAPVEQAILAYYAALNQAFATGDLSGYTPLHTADCSACMKFTTLIRETQARGERFDGVGDLITSYNVADFRGDNALVDVRFTIPAYRIVASDGREVGSYAEEKQRNVVVLRRVGGKWLVSGVTKRAG
jgi:hypothetical protein